MRFFSIGTFLFVTFLLPPAATGGIKTTAMEPDPNPADEALMAQVADGSDSAFMELVRRHQNRLVNFFRRMGVYTDAEDLVQETFLRAYKYRAKYRPSAKFTTFLFVLARHVHVDRTRQAVRRDRLHAALQADSETVASAGQPARPGRDIDTQALLDRLSPKLREVLVLNIYQGLRYQEVADVLHIPLGTVKSRINLALRAIREQLDEQRSNP